MDRVLYKSLFSGPYLRPRCMENAHRGTNAVPLNFNLGLLLANDEVEVSRVCSQV